MNQPVTLALTLGAALLLMPSHETASLGELFGCTADSHCAADFRWPDLSDVPENQPDRNPSRLRKPPIQHSLSTTSPMMAWSLRSS